MVANSEIRGEVEDQVDLTENNTKATDQSEDNAKDSALTENNVKATDDRSEDSAKATDRSEDSAKDGAQGLGEVPVRVSTKYDPGPPPMEMIGGESSILLFRGNSESYDLGTSQPDTSDSKSEEFFV